MDTKWKNKAILIITTCLLITYGLTGIVVLIKNGEEYIGTDYFQTDLYEHELHTFTDLLSKRELNPLSEEEAISQIDISLKELEEYREDRSHIRIYNREEYEALIQQAWDQDNEELVQEYTEKIQTLIEEEQRIQQDEEYARNKIKEEKIESIRSYYSERENEGQLFEEFQHVFRYFLKDTQTGEVYTNMDVKNEEQIEEKLKEHSVFHTEKYSGSAVNYLNTVPYYPGVLNHLGSKYEGVIAVLDVKESDHSLSRQYNFFKQKKGIFYIHIISGLLACIIGLLFIKKMLSIISKSYEKVSSWNFFRSIPMDLSILIAWVSAKIFFRFLPYLNRLYDKDNVLGYLKEVDGQKLLWPLFVSFIVGLFILQVILLYIKLNKKNIKSELKRSVIFLIYTAVKEAYLPLTRSSMYALIVSLTIVLSPVIYLTIWQYTYLGHRYTVDSKIILLIIFIMLPALIIITRLAGYLNKIIRNTAEIAKGNMVPDLPVQGKSTLALLANDINTLKAGVQTSLAEQAKSERLKTELITNVSHDLRTPLTSIITYTELLKRTDVTAEERNKYIDVIDRKSKRLNVLIEDLFEASKMISGNIELNKSDVDVIQLLQQSLGEYEDLINKSTIQFRLNMPEDPVIIYAEGQKIWRVFDNIIENILNYSLENTRAFISVHSGENDISITFKNITKEELSEDTDELFERFKRGDTSRHTDGSGLGLAIAKSIIELHDGELDIEVDGDLFKISIRIKI